jgi:hypothetical protein
MGGLMLRWIGTGIGAWRELRVEMVGTGNPGSLPVPGSRVPMGLQSRAKVSLFGEQRKVC